MLPPKHSLFHSALNLVISIPQALPAQQTNGLCACLLLSWPQEFSTPPSRGTFLGFELFTLNRGFQTPLPTASAFRGRSAVSSALRAPHLLLPCLLLDVSDLAVAGFSPPRSPYALGYFLPWVLWLSSCLRVHCPKSSLLLSFKSFRCPRHCSGFPICTLLHAFKDQGFKN